MLVYLAVQQKRAGLDAESLAKWVENNKLTVCHWFTVDDLNYLKRGGRVSATAALLGTMLSIKPVMQYLQRGQAGAGQQGPGPQGSHTGAAGSD